MSRGAHLHQPFYCEENVWHLCSDPSLSGRTRLAVFSSGARGFVMWHQRAARHPSAPILWDYHAVLLVGTPWEIWDLDTTLGLPVRAADYLEQSFREGLPDELMPRFRLVDADAFVATFASDRSHMRGPDGRFQKPPPPWATIGRAGAPSNLARFIDMTDSFVGEVLALREMLERFGGRNKT